VKRIKDVDYSFEGSPNEVSKAGNEIQILIN
jgi:hypothetical protein